jgi:hypothetical protein
VHLRPSKPRKAGLNPDLIEKREEAIASVNGEGSSVVNLGYDSRDPGGARPTLNVAVVELAIIPLGRASPRASCGLPLGHRASLGRLNR